MTPPLNLPMINKGILRWLTLDMLLFVVVNAYLIARHGDKFSRLTDIGFLQLLVLGLAAYRAANIVSNEVVTKPLRAPFVDEEKKGSKTVEKPKRSGFLGATGLLIYCPSCTGVWLSAAIVYFYVFWPVQTFLVSLFLALSAIERIVAASLGWLRQENE